MEPAAATGVVATERSDSKRNARLYLSGLAASLLGDSAMILVAGIWVKALTGSSSAAALVSACVYAPSLAGPVAGVLADRFRRRPLLIVVNLVAAAAMLLLLLVRSDSEAWLIYLVMIGYGIVAVVIDPAENALFAVMLPDDVRQRVNGVRLSLQEGGKLVAPLVGAGLFVVLGGGAVAALDAATFVLAAYLISRLRVDEPPVRAAERRWTSEMVAGFGYLRHDLRLRNVVLAGAAVMAVSGVAAGAQYGLVDALHRSPGFLGVLTAALGGGSIVAGVTSARLITRVGENGLVLLGLVDFAIGNLLRATGWLPTAVAGFVVLGFALPWVLVGVINLAQSSAPADLQGRVAAVVVFAFFASQPFAHGLGALAIAYASYRDVYCGAAVLALLVAASFWRSIRTRSRVAFS